MSVDRMTDQEILRSVLSNIPGGTDPAAYMAGAAQALLTARSTPVPAVPVVGRMHKMPKIVPPLREPHPELLDDILSVVGTRKKIHCDQICVLLDRRWPDKYRGWDVHRLNRELSWYSVRTRQVWTTSIDGHDRNRRGIFRQELAAAVKRSRAKEAAS